MGKPERLVALVEEDQGIPERAREAFVELRERRRSTAERIEGLERRIVAHARHDDTARRLATIPGIGPITASPTAATVGDAIGDFPSARHFAAWLGLVPRQHSSGGKTRLGRIAKAGDRGIRTLPVLGATSMVHRAGRRNSAAGAWVRGLLERRPVRQVTAALADKTARTAWAVMARGGVHRAQGGVAPAAATA